MENARATTAWIQLHLTWNAMSSDIFLVNFKDFTFSIFWRNLSLKIVLTLPNTVNSNFRYNDSRAIYRMYVLAQLCYLFRISVIFNQGYNSLLLLRSILFIALICTTYRHTSDVHLYCWVSSGRHDKKTNSGFVLVFVGIYHNTIIKQEIFWQFLSFLTSKIT